MNQLDKSVPFKEISIETWIESVLAEVITASPNVRKEYILPPSIDHMKFIAIIGMPSRDFEIGGIYNTKSRSMIIQRGAKREERAFDANPQISHIKHRLNKDGTTDDIFFHTHPWQQDDPIHVHRTGITACEPSDTDLNNPLLLRDDFDRDGIDQIITSIISSGGYLTVTRASGITANREMFRELGLTNEQISEVLSVLCRGPKKWFKNIAKEDAQSQEDLMELLNQFYDRIYLDKDTTLEKKLRTLRENASPLCTQRMRRGHVEETVDWLIESIYAHAPQHLTATQLTNFGINESKHSAILMSTGLTINKFQYQNGELSMV